MSLCRLLIGCDGVLELALEGSPLEVYDWRPTTDSSTVSESMNMRTASSSPSSRKEAMGALARPAGAARSLYTPWGVDVTGCFAGRWWDCDAVIVFGCICIYARIFKSFGQTQRDSQERRKKKGKQPPIWLFKYVPRADADFALLIQRCCQMPHV